MNFEKTCACIAIRILKQCEEVVKRVREWSQSIRCARNDLYMNFELDRIMGTMELSLHVHV